MARFYQDVMCFTETDRGDLGTVQLVFLSRDPSEHHQIVLASGRPADMNFNVINQISLRVPDLATLRLMRDRVAADADVTELLCATHGATYAPDTGDCVGGPCRGGLVKITLSEADGVVHWHTEHNLKPLEF